MTRIIGGSAGGRRLRTPRGQVTRPTSDRVREALFSALESECGTLTGRRFLDLYAGSGAVGLEAMSRGAAAVTAVESDRRTARLVRVNAAMLDFEDVEVLCGPVASLLVRPRINSGISNSGISRTAGDRGASLAPYDVVFADPPYALSNDEVEEVLAKLLAHGWLAAGSVLVVERSSRSAEPAWPRGLVRERARKYGETVLWYVRADPEVARPRTLSVPSHPDD